MGTSQLARQVRLAGRATELTQLKRIYHEIQEDRGGRGRLVTLAGGTGIGKSALARSFIAGIMRAEPKAIALTARCVVGRTNYRPFGPFLDMLGQLGRQAGEDALVAILAKEVPSWQPGASQSVGRSSLFDQFLSLCGAITRQRPLILFIDEVQWSDRSSLDLLARLGGGLNNLPVLIVTTYEEHTSDNAVSIKAVQQRVGSNSVDLVVRGLEDESILDLAESVLEGPFSSELTAWLIEAAQGVPMRAEQFVRWLSETGLIRKRLFRYSLRSRQLPLPTSGIYDVLAGRMDDLEPNLRWTLEAAAYSGSLIDSSVVAAQVGKPEGEIRAQLRTADRLYGLVEVLEERRWPDGRWSVRFDFRHPLIRKVLVERVSEKRRAHLWVRAARALERLANTDDRELTGEIAALYISADAQPKAFEWSLKAADLAEHLYALYETDEFLRVAARTTESELERLRIENRLAKIYAATGREPEAEALQESVFGRAREHGDKVTEVRAGTMLGWLRLERGVPPLKLWEHAGEMVATARSEEMSEEFVAALDLASVVAERVGRAEEALMMAEEALHIAEGSGSPELMAQAAYRLARVHMSWDSPEKGRELAERALDVFTQMDEQVGVAVCHDLLGLANFRAGEWDGALHHWESALESMEVAGVPDQKIAMQVNIADLLTLRGEFERALQLFKSGLRLAEELDDAQLARRCQTGISRLEFERGEYAKVLELTEDIRRALPESGAWRENFQTTAIRALSYLEMGDELQAWSEATRLEQLYQGKEGWFDRRAEGDAVRMRVIDLDSDAWLAGTVARQGIGETEGKDPYGEGFLQYHRACVLARAQPGEARRAAERAVELFARLGAAPMLKRSEELREILSTATEQSQTADDGGIDESRIDDFFDSFEG